MSSTSALANQTTAIGAPSEVPLLELRNVCRSYEKHGVAALDRVSFSLREGEAIAIVGPSGCGKTTLLNIMGALDQPDQGTVLYEGKTLGSVSECTIFRRHTVGFVFQAFHLLPTLTALENVQVPMLGTALDRSARADRALYLLKEVGLLDRCDHLPSELSGGERQRVALARSLANEPKLLLADEPTGNLDSANCQRIIDLLKKIASENAVALCLVTHDVKLAAQCASRLLHLHDGRILHDEHV